jgi:hypothetical protein
MPTPVNKKLYNEVKAYIYSIYRKPSAYRSGAVVKLYKQLGGKYKEDSIIHSIDHVPLARWFQERWINVNTAPEFGNYPVYRPTIRITEKTPTTVYEIPKKRLKEQSKLKQIIKGTRNLPKF